MTKKEQRKTIKGIATGILSVYEIKPIRCLDDLTVFINTLGGKLIYSPHVKEDILEKTDNHNFRIILKQDLSKEQKLWNAAVRLGDLFLHMQFLNTKQYRNRESYKPYENQTEQDQYQSNFFAGCILMPEADYKQIIENHTETIYCNGKPYQNRIDVKNAAQAFPIPTACFRWYGQQLGYLMPNFPSRN